MQVTFRCSRLFHFSISTQSYQSFHSHSLVLIWFEMSRLYPSPVWLWIWGQNFYPGPVLHFLVLQTLMSIFLDSYLIVNEILRHIITVILPKIF